MAEGYLRTVVLLDTDISPIQGARVILSDLAGNVLYDTITDEHGTVPIMTLPAPDAAVTLDPNYPGLPFALYNMDVTKPGFHSTLIRYIEVLAGQTSTQPVTMHRATPEEIARGGPPVEHIIIIGTRHPGLRPHG